METYDYLSCDTTAGKKAMLTSDFAGALSKAFEHLREARAVFADACDTAISAKVRLEEAEREVITGELNKGPNAEVRKAKLDEIVKPVRDILFDRQREQRSAEYALQCASDYVRELQMLLEAVRLGMVQPLVDPDPDMPF